MLLICKILISVMLKLKNTNIKMTAQKFNIMLN